MWWTLEQSLAYCIAEEQQIILEVGSSLQFVQLTVMLEQMAVVGQSSMMAVQLEVLV